MDFRSLIEKAMFEARDEFAAIMARKLEALLGVGASPLPRRGRPRTTDAGRPPQNRARARVVTKSGEQRRAAPEDMARIKEKVLAVMKPGQTMRKGEIMRLAKLPDDEDVRVRLVLTRLKASGLVTMLGTRGGAAYRLKGSD